MVEKEEGEIIKTTVLVRIITCTIELLGFALVYICIISDSLARIINISQTNGEQAKKKNLM